MIINILLFLSLYSYGSTPGPREPNELFKDNSCSAQLSARYNNLKNFYINNFADFYEKFQKMTKEEVEKLLKNDDWYPKKEQIFSENIFNDIRVFFKSLLDKSKKDLKKSEKKENITCDDKFLEYHLSCIFYELLFHKSNFATRTYSFLGKVFSFKIDDFSPTKESKVVEKNKNEEIGSSPVINSKKSIPEEKIFNHYDKKNKRLDVMLHFIEKNFNDIWNSFIKAYEKNSEKDKSAIADTENIFKQAYVISSELEYSMFKNIKIKNKLLEQLNIAKKNEKFNHATSELIEEAGINFLCLTFDAFVNSGEAKIFFGHYVIDFPDEENSENILSEEGFLAFLPKNLFHRYFTPFEVLTFSSFLIKKFVKPSSARNFLNNSFGSNFTKKQGVRYLEKYFLPHSGKLFIGGTILHALLVGSQSMKKELKKLEKIEF